MIVDKKKYWTFPWSVKENLTIIVGLIVIGFFLEFITNGKGVPVLFFPFNLVIIIFLILFCLVFYLLLKKDPFFQWITSVQAAITSVIALSVIVLLMGFIPQNDTQNSILSKIGITHLFRSWPYFFSMLLLLLVLGSTIIKRFGKWNLRNIAFFLNHFGLWIVIATGSLGSSDIQKNQMICYLNKPVWYGVNSYNKVSDLPFAIELKQFTIEDYNPEIVLIKTSSGQVIKEKNNFQFIAEKGKKGNLEGFEICVKELIRETIFMGDSFHVVHQPGAVPAARVQILKDNKIFSEGWISAYSFLQPPQFLRVSDSLSLALMLPAPKKFVSDIKIYSSDEKVYLTKLEVNKPFKIMGWELYQYSYDTEKGKYSEYSVIEAIRDPWLKIVYVGIYMLLAGSVLLFWVGKSVKVEET